MRNFLPSAAKGHVLITTRAQAVGRIAKGTAIDAMTPEEGALFLMRRAGILEPDTTLDATRLEEYLDALKVAQIMGGLPLALDQAGAYIEEVGCTIGDYVNRYKTHRTELLQRRGTPIFDHPEPVATTWSLSFQRVKEAKPVAAELLKLCAFLSPDEIPEEIIAEGSAELGPELSSLANNPLEIDDAIAELRRYSLILRHPENKTLSIHRLVQTVLRDAMTLKEQQVWAERATRAVNHYDNPFFTDREHELVQIYAMLKAGPEDRVHTHVINGLGGVGKTQVALAYAHSYKHLYKTVLWVDASTHNTLISSLINIADALKLKLAGAERQNDQKVITTIRLWLEAQANWLLILDNIEDPRSAQDLIPSISNGHILFTARTQATGTLVSSTYHLDELKPEDGALLLLRRTKKLEVYNTFEQANENVRKTALKLSYVLGNLPLMLDQAGAYIEETNIDMLNYLEYYEDNKLRHTLLRWRGDMTSDHLESVTETWNNAFEIIPRANPAAYDLLRFCAFLSPEDIPEEIITEGAAKLLPTLQPFAHDPLQKNQAIAALRKYSLLDQNAEMRTFSMNRMVQIVLRDKMSESEQFQWIERVIAAVHYTLGAIRRPDAGSSIINHGPRYHPHVEVCACHMKDWNVTSAESASLLHLMGRHLYDYARHVSHDPSLPIQLEHTYIVKTLESYTVLLKQMNQIVEAEELAQYANSIRAAIPSNV